jgi:hypothetical protein
MRTKRNYLFLFCFLALGATAAHGEGTTSLLSVDRIFHDNEFEINTKVASKWLRGGESYTTIEQSESVADGFDVVRHDPSSGEQSILAAASQTWDTDLQLWHMLLAQQGYIIASVDPRGTPAPNGRAWRKSIYGQIGILASADEAKAVQATSGGGAK